MAEHLSALALDEAAVGAFPEGAKAHLEACAECRARLETLTAMNARLMARPEARRALDAVKAAASPALQRRTVPRWALFAVPLAAALALFFLVPRDEPEARLKGVATVEVIDEAGAVVRAARAGQRVAVAVGAAEHTHVAVLAVEASGAVSVLWPRGELFRPVARGARVRLEPPFDVTPGTVVLHAFFADSALPIEAAGTALREAVKAAGPLEAKTPAGAWSATAMMRLEVP